MGILDSFAKMSAEFLETAKAQEKELLAKNDCADLAELVRKHDQMRLGQMLYTSPEKMN